ncbi:Autophagy protein 5 [Vermiconidia calcicola]|uniref:Autophagy protein 5 n=1 Tax=Vermiconidia calcicola TaxID=1690605 RepID=A0ACC3NA81_9PEZI|nr:Autophagy protein 5 [Vermiconidia calcicola]
MPAPSSRLADLQRKIWNGSIPLEVRLAASDCRTYDESEPYLVQPPRLSYLAFLLPQLHAFFKPSLIDPQVQPHEAWLSFEGVPLKWHYPFGLLYDLFSGAEPVDFDKQRNEDPATSQATVETASGTTPLPWRLTAHFTEYPGDQLIQLDADGRALLDSYINAVKEADFIRNGNARTVMSLSKGDSDNLWRAVQTYDLNLFNSVNSKLLNPPGMELRHVPLKIYLPTSASQTASETITEEAKQAGHIRVVQSLVPLHLPSRQPQTLGTALNSILPSIFPSRRNPLLAQPVLHGVVVPLGAHLNDLGRTASYLDGFLHVAVVMLG